ncbi:MAG TPA: EF-P lysine aminoacylase EpmA [Polyangium sp.]|nr:EF-P lysine aminoacylase EpmA [Polyangium sp.]
MNVSGTMFDPDKRARDVPYAPSDLKAIVGAPGSLRVAGRVLEVHGSDIILADAFERVTVTLDDGDVLAGDHVIVEAQFVQDKLTSGRVVERFRPAKPKVSRGASAEEPTGETERFVLRGVGRSLEARARAFGLVRSFFDRRGFVEVDTPSMVPCPGLDLHLDAYGVAESPHWLITSPEYQMKRLLVGGIPRCYQLARCYRRGEVGGRHNPEFLMLEWYRAFAPVDAVIDDTEELVRHVITELSGKTEVLIEGVRVDLSPPFERLTVGEAFARHARVSADEAISWATTDEDRFFRVLVDEVEPALARLGRPVFLTEYPAPFASLARLSPKDPRVAERFELYVGSLEVCNGFGELTDPVEQRERFLRDQEHRKARGKPVYPLDERFLAALEEGMPPAAGNALGLDRLVALGLSRKTIADVTSFPFGWL